MTNGTQVGRGVAIPAPTTANGMTAAEVARWHGDQRILNADPRTAGSANRPAWLVRQVLREAGR